MKNFCVFWMWLALLFGPTWLPLVGNDAPIAVSVEPTKVPLATVVPENDQAILLFIAVNDVRQRYGALPLALDESLQPLAEQHANDMAEQDKLYHSNLAAVLALGYTRAGEAVAKGDGTPQAIVTTWMASPAHRAIVLGNYQFAGVAQKGLYWELLVGGKP